MDRATRFIANRKQDKIRVVKDQPSIQSMREGEEVLFFGRDGVLSRYRKERGQLWRSDMTKGESNKVGGTLKTSRLEYSSSFVDSVLFHITLLLMLMQVKFIYLGLMTQNLGLSELDRVF